MLYNFVLLYINSIKTFAEEVLGMPAPYWFLMYNIYTAKSATTNLNNIHFLLSLQRNLLLHLL